MASELILEDGTGVADANSYANAADTRTFASVRGIALPAVPDAGVDPVEAFLVLAADYINTLCFVGHQATATQSLVWPRVLTHPYLAYPFLCDFDYWMMRLGTIDPSYFVLPPKIKTAQMQLVIEQNNGIVLQPSTPGGIAGQFITRLKVDVIETAYSEKLGTLSTPTMPSIDALLRDLVIRGAGTLRSVRV